jgi:hypothetical protein
MNNKHKVYNLIILDESGSMQSIKKTIINGFNEVVKTIKSVALEYPEQEHTITLMSFNEVRLNKILENMPISHLNEINENSYLPDSNTPLFDAMGHGILNLSRIIEKDNPPTYNVLVTILTDGEENASKEFNSTYIKSLVESCKEKNWTFTYIGANHDVKSFAARLSISNVMKFEMSEEDMQRIFNQDRDARMNYSRKIRMNEDTRDNYFEDNKPEVKPSDSEETPVRKSIWKKLFGF